MIELLPSGKSEGYEVCADDVALAVISPVAARNRAQAEAFKAMLDDMLVGQMQGNEEE